MITDELEEKLQKIESERDLPNAIIVTNVPVEVGFLIHFTKVQSEVSNSDL